MLFTTRPMPSFCSEDERHEKIEFMLQEKIGGQNTDDCVRVTVQPNRATHKINVAAKSALPQSVVQHNDFVFSGFLLVRQEASPKNGSHSQNIEKCGGDSSAIQTFWTLLAGQIHVNAVLDD